MPTTDITELHDHYARNAQARGHAPTCRKVTDERNWPTIMGRPPCTCPAGPEPSPAGDLRERPVRCQAAGCATMTWNASGRCSDHLGGVAPW